MSGRTFLFVIGLDPRDDAPYPSRMQNPLRRLSSHGTTVLRRGATVAFLDLLAYYGDATDQPAAVRAGIRSSPTGHTMTRSAGWRRKASSRTAADTTPNKSSWSPTATSGPTSTIHDPAGTPDGTGCGACSSTTFPRRTALSVGVFAVFSSATAWASSSKASGSRPATSAPSTTIFRRPSASSTSRICSKRERSSAARPQELVRNAWDMETLQTDQQRFLDQIETWTAQLRAGPSGHTLLSLAAQEIEAYLACMRDDPLLPRLLAPPRLPRIRRLPGPSRLHDRHAKGPSAGEAP